MTAREKTLLFFSVIASVAIWGWLYSWKAGLVIVFSVIVHEYGHYRQMGKEGVGKRTMFFLPPFGAVAIAKEQWPSRLAEAKIALAGPIFGLVSVLVFVSAWLAWGGHLWLAAAAWACIVNLFNLLLPIAILDGGRVIKSICFSISNNLGKMFYLLSFGCLGVVFLVDPRLFLLLILVLFFLNSEYQGFKKAPVLLERVKLAQQYALSARDQEPEERVQVIKALTILSGFDCSEEALERQKRGLELIANPPPMSRSQILGSFGVFAGVIGVHSLSLLLAVSGLGISASGSFFESLLEYFK